jgi:hypothetical protein
MLAVSSLNSKGFFLFDGKPALSKTDEVSSQKLDEHTNFYLPSVTAVGTNLPPGGPQHHRQVRFL